MKRILTSLLLMAISIAAHAQFNYSFSVRQQAYQPLSNSIKVNDTTRWDDEFYKVPIGFTFKIDGDTISALYCQEGFYATDSQGRVNGFMAVEMDLHDRGAAGGTTSQSPLSYEVTGVAPNRIFKYEIHNAGMYDEYDLYGTNNDSLNHQVWLYEIDNAFEIHYGPSNITYPADYHFLTDGTPVIGFMRNVSMIDGSLSKFYYLSGNASAPVIDSATSLLGINSYLSGYPASGTVYRFAPAAVDVKKVEKVDLQVTLLSNIGSTVQVSNNSKVATRYKVVGITGANTIINGELAQGRSMIDVSSLATGMYVLLVQNENGKRMFRFMKQ